MKRKVTILLLIAVLLLSGCSAPQEDNAVTEPSLTESTTVPTVEIIEPERSAPTLLVHFLSTGQSDCILAQCGGQTLLIDSGAKATSALIVDYLQRQGVEKLDYVISTHEHYDHVGGFPAVFDRFPVGTVYGIPSDYVAVPYESFLSSLERHGLALRKPELGEQFSLGDAVVTFLGPVRKYENMNDNSIVVKIEYGRRSFLLAADMEAEAEADMMEYWGTQVSWTSDVLKAGHHGLNTSTTQAFARAVRPEYAVATSASKTKNNGAMNTLLEQGTVFFRTNVVGNVIFSTCGTNLNVVWQNQKECPDYPLPRADILYYKSSWSSLFHMERCPSLVSTQGTKKFYSAEAALRYGLTPCGLCLGGAVG